MVRLDCQVVPSSVVRRSMPLLPVVSEPHVQPSVAETNWRSWGPAKPDTALVRLQPQLAPPSVVARSSPTLVTANSSPGAAAEME